jgi:hypothetical protein
MNSCQGAETLFFVLCWRREAATVAPSGFPARALIKKALVVLGVQASQLPPRGETLEHEDAHLLTARPGTARKRDDMAKAYRELGPEQANPDGFAGDFL